MATKADPVALYEKRVATLPGVEPRPARKAAAKPARKTRAK